jgi:hypothetical protein
VLKTPLKENDVVSLKLSTGEEVIGRLAKAITADSITIKKVFTLGQGPNGVGLMPWAFTFDPSDEVSIDRRNVIAHSPTVKEIADAYTKQTSGIQLAGAGDLNNLGGQK